MELHGVFAYTIFGDRIRVTHYTDWRSAIDDFTALDTAKRIVGICPTIKHFCVRSWDDPQWNQARYRSMDSVNLADLEYGAMQ